MNQKQLQEKIDKFIERCKQMGLNITHQRIAIYTELITSKEHPSPEMVYQKVHHKFPMISLATVYKTLNTFSTLKLINQLNTSQDVIRYDGNLVFHNHFVCQKCGTIDDVPISVLGRIELPEKIFKKYKINSYGLVLTGVCDSCQKMHNQDE